MSTSLLVAKERQPGSPFGLRQKQAKKQKNYGANAPQLHPILKKYGANAPQLRPIRCSLDFYVILCNEQAKKAKKYGANAPQLRAIRCSIEYCVILCNETAFNPVQTWLSDFSALCRSATVGMASLLRKQQSSKEKRGER